MRFSVLDLVPVAEGGSIGRAIQNSVELAKQAEKSGYYRYWIAEHHSIPGVASSATSVLIGHIASVTTKMRIGSGGIMLPNHSPLVIAEQFGTLETLYPGRIDLGLGRAPGGDYATMQALRRGPSSADEFPRDVLELQGYLGEPLARQPVLAIPGQGTHVPLYLLGSSTFSARLAAELGLPFAFASHFAPASLLEAIRLYRSLFIPSENLPEPLLIVAVNCVAADTDDEARYLFTTMQQMFLQLIRGAPGQMLPPVKEINWTPTESAQVERMLSVSAVGGPETLQQQLQEIIELTKPDEIIVNAHIYDHQARLRSFEHAAKVLAKCS